MKLKLIETYLPLDALAWAAEREACAGEVPQVAYRLDHYGADAQFL